MKKYVSVLCMAVALQHGFSASAITINGASEGANAKSSGVVIESFSEKGLMVNERVHFNDSGYFTINIKADKPRLYWINSIPYYLYPDDVISLDIPAIKATVLGASGISAGGSSLSISGMSNKEIKVAGKRLPENTLVYKLLQEWQRFSKLHFGDSSSGSLQAIYELEALNRKMISASTKDKLLLQLATYLNNTEGLRAKLSYVNNKMEKPAAGNPVYDILKKVSLDDPLINQTNTLLLANIVMAYTNLVIYNTGTTDEEGFKKARFLLENVNNQRVLNEQAGQFVTLRFRDKGLDQNLLDLLPLAKEKLTDAKLLAQIEKTEKDYKTIYKGAMAPAFTLKGADAKTYSLADYKGKVVAIDVWATWCSGCVKELPNFISLRNEYKDNADIVFITVSIDSDGEKLKWKDFLNKRGIEGIDLSTIDDKEKSFKAAYNITGIPRYIIIDKEGKMLVSHGPKPSSGEYRNLLETALKAK